MDNNKTDEQFINMRASGQSLRQISRKLKKSPNKLCDLNKKYFREISDLKNAKLEVLQKIVFERKKARLDFLTEQLENMKDALKNREMLMRYDTILKMSLKIADSLNKCERDMLITDFAEDEINFEEEQNNALITNVIGKTEEENTDNREVTTEKKSVDNKITKNKKSLSEKHGKIGNQLKNKCNQKNIEEKTVEPPPPRTRADYYLRALKNKNVIPADCRSKMRSGAPGPPT
jgi:hypothetical protein